MDKTSELEQIKAKIGITELSGTTAKDFEKIQELAANGDITKEQMKLLVEAIPHFVQLQQAYVDGLKSVISSAKETQKDALRGISVTLENITDLLKTIVHKSETEELRSKIADIALKLADYGLEIAKIMQETNKENNNTWKYIAGGVSAVVMVVGGLLLRRK
ncbi:hypothetical protein VST7929_02964 [Vibrio stylophorae]|uniref:DUF1640 domain-containing protein n=1 Tax=Vibrio stylophorae TaxID=659351 RepID=A0ABM8ZYH3_9VIBR|nr:DUF334 domain-containing protein [Vibrio stylophorae]CAH0535391.1 hypothetical protein VST7929_02964 [Vibrio stylophorae]